MLSELCAEISARLPRSDQRRKGEMYLRGMVQLPGTRRPLVLLGEWTGKDGWPQRCWLSDLADIPWGPLLRGTSPAGG
ncbi:hypothetical protein ACWGIU_17145 [Streptomyces sp. NPDC054840]